VHLSFDLSGKVKFGPDVFWIEGIDYSFNESRKDDFVSAIKTYWPDLNPDKLFPDYTGIRPKIYGPTEEPADFVIQTSKQHKIKGLVNLFGIESPGLTCSLPLAKKVANLLF
jgi:L-2-hydroxyglutarate oxidase LhgO